MSDENVKRIVSGVYGVLRGVEPCVLIAGFDPRDADLESVLDVCLGVVKRVVYGYAGQLIVCDVCCKLLIVENTGENTEGVVSEILIGQVVRDVSDSLSTADSDELGSATVSAGEVSFCPPAAFEHDASKSPARSKERRLVAFFIASSLF